MRNCPNCGANIKHSYNYNCEYCGTFLKHTNENIKEINRREITNVKVMVKRDCLYNAVLVQITGNTIPKFDYYEEVNENKVYVSSSDYKKIGFNVLVPFEIYYKLTPKEIVIYITKNLPPVFRNNHMVLQEIFDVIFENYRKV